MQRTKVSITLPCELLSLVEERRSVMSSLVGCDLTLSQTVQMLLFRAIDSHRQQCATDATAEG